jgi:hypothetical protein
LSGPESRTITLLTTSTHDYLNAAYSGYGMIYAVYGKVGTGKSYGLHAVARGRTNYLYTPPRSLIISETRGGEYFKKVTEVLSVSEDISPTKPAKLFCDGLTGDMNPTTAVNAAAALCAFPREDDGSL